MDRGRKELTKSYLFGADIGTLVSKGAIVDLNGNIIANHSVEHPVIHPKPGWAEHDPEKHWWNDFVRISRTLLNKSKINPKDILGISVSGLIPDLCPLDKNGKPVRNAILYSDNRAFKEIEFINKLLGSALTSEEITPKILWFKKNEPENFAKTHMVLNAPNYVVYKLTDRYSVDYTLAYSFGAIFDILQLKWDEGVCNQLGIPLDILPPAYPAYKVIGAVTDEATKKTGLAKDTPVIVGTSDVLSSMLGAGLTEAGDAMIYYGTAGLFLILNCKLIDLMSMNFERMRYPPIVQGAYVLTTGGLLRWFRDQFGHYEFETGKKLGVSAYHVLDDEASRIPPGSGGLIVLPYFMGQRTPSLDPLAKGVIFGLSMAHTRAHVYRAFLEAFGYTVYYSFDKLKEEEVPIKRIVAIGGGAKSEIWRQIVSDIINMPQEYIAKADATLGNAYMAGFGVGTFKDFKNIQKWLEVTCVTKPRLEAHKSYESFFKVYRNLHQNMKDRYVELAEALK